MHEKMKKLLSIIIVFLLTATLLSTTVSASWINSEKTTMKEKIQTLKEKTNDLIENIAKSKNTYGENNEIKASGSTTIINTIQSITALNSVDSTLRFFTNYDGIEKETRLKLFLETKIDIDGENGNDIGVKYTIRPGIVRPFALSVDFKLTIRQLLGFNQLDENAFFEGFAELYFPGFLVKNLTGDRVKFGYQSPEGEKTPEKCEVVFKFIPNLLSIRKKAGFSFGIIPDAATAGNAKLNLLAGLAEMDGNTVVSEVYSKTIYNPAVESEISLSRSKKLGSRVFDFEKQRADSSQVDMYVAITEGDNSTYAYVKDLPEHVTLSSKSGREGFIEFDAHGEAVDEIGVCDDFDNPINKAYFSNMFTSAKIEWNRDRLFLLKNGKANVSVYTEGEGVSFNVYLEGGGNGSVDFSATPAEAIIDIFMELDLSEGYFVLKHSSFNISVSLIGHGPDQGTLDASFDLKKTEDNPLEIFFNGLKEGNAEIYLAGKSFEINNLDIKMKSYLSLLNGEYSISMDHLEKTKEGSIGSTFSIVKEDKNFTIHCSIDIVHGVKITNLVLKFNNFEFKRTNIDETGTITHWYNFSLNITDVEWHDHDDWGYILIKGDNSAFFSFDSKYWDNEELIGTVSGAIQLKTLGDVFNISWDTVDGNKTYYFDGSGVTGLYDFHLWMKDKIDVSIPEISGSFNINTNEKSGELILFFDGSSSMLKVDIEDMNVTDLFDITLHGSIDIDIAGSTSGTIGIGWNETGTYFFDTNFGMDITGSITITEFLFAYQENLVNVSFTEIAISGDLNLSIVSDDEGILISGDSDLTNIVITDLSIYLSLSKPLQVSLDADITFDGNGDITAKYVNDTFLLNGEVSGDSEIFVNSFWFLVPIPSMPVEINLENLRITGLTTIVFDVNTSQTTPFMITIYADQEINADIIYLGMAPFLQIYVNDFVGGGTDGNLGIGWNTQTGQPVFNFDHSSCSIGALQFIMMGTPIEISDISLDGTMEIEGFLDLGAFSFVYVYGTVYEDTTITLENLNIPVIGLCDISIVLEPGKLDLLVQQNLISGGDDAYIYGYSSGWITIRVNDTDLIKIMGTLDLWLHLHMGDDGTISVALDAKEVSGAVVIADTLRFIGEANAELEFSVKIVEEDGTTTISNPYFNLTGQITAVLQIKTDESEWIPIIPFSSSGQVVMFRQTGFMGTPNIVDDFEIVTPEDNASLIFEVWYAPPLGEDSDSIGPFTYDIDFGDGSTYEVTTDESRITIDSHLYDIGSHTASVTVTPTDTSYTPVDDSLSFTIIKRDPTYMELVDNGPASFTYADAEDDGRIHTWFTIRNTDEGGYSFNWEASILPWGISFEGMDPIIEPESGILNPGESIKIDASFLPPPDHKEHIMSIWPGAENIDYTGTHPEEDGVGFPISIRQSLSLVPGAVYLPSLNPGEERTSSFWIWNNKDEALSWSLTDYPNSYFSFSSTSGTIPRFGAEIVHFTVSAPDEEGVDLGGDIEITDLDDPLNVATVPVNVKTKGSNSTNENVTITEEENGDVSIAIGGLTEIHIDHFQFEINGVIGELNGHFLFDTVDSYVYINFTKNDLTTLSLDGNAEFSIENFHFAYGDNINIEISKVITGGFNFAQGKSGIFYLVVDDTFTDIDIDIHLNHEFSNFTLSGNIDIDINSALDGSLWIEWDLNGDIKDVNIDGDLLGYNHMEVSITDFNFTMNNFSFTADEIYFNRAVDLWWNSTDLSLESETAITASNIGFKLNSDLSIILASGNIIIDGSILFQFRVYSDHFRLFISTTGLTLYGTIHVTFGEYYGSLNLFFKIIGEMWIEVYLN